MVYITPDSSIHDQIQYDPIFEAEAPPQRSESESGVEDEVRSLYLTIDRSWWIKTG